MSMCFQYLYCRFKKSLCLSDVYAAASSECRFANVLFESLLYICASEYPFVCLLGGNVVLAMTVYMTVYMR